MSTALVVLVSGLAEGALLVLVAVGLSLTYGAMRLLNMAHGGFFMLGAFVLYSLTPLLANPGGSVGAIVAASITVLFVGMIAEVLIYRRLYTTPPLTSLLGLFALMLILQGVAQLIWGTTPVYVAPNLGALNGTISVGRASIPLYYVMLIAVGALASGGLATWLRKSTLGRETRAIAYDRQMASLLGIRTKRVFRVTLAIGMVFAGLAGALISPTVAIDPSLGANYIILAFAVVVVGGMDNIFGTIGAGFVLGLLDSWVTFVAPAYSGYTIYAAMIVILTVRPRGLFGGGAHVTL